MGAWMDNLSFFPSFHRWIDLLAIVIVVVVVVVVSSYMLEITIDTMFYTIHINTHLAMHHEWFHCRDRLVDEEISSRILRANRRLIQQELRRAHLKHTPGD